MKRYILFIIAVMVCVLAPADAECTELITEQYRASGIADVYDINSDIFPEFDSVKLVEDIVQGKGVDGGGIIKRLLSFLLREFTSTVKISVAVIATGFAVSVLGNVSEVFSSRGAAEVAAIVGYCVFSGILTAGFSAVTAPARETVEMLCVMLKATISVLLGMATLSGSAVKVSLVDGMLMSMINVVGDVMQKIVIPLTLCSVSLSVAGNMSNKINVSSLVQSVRKLAKWIMLFSMAVYGGFFGVYGISGNAIDSALGKAARFAIGSGIPIVGGVVAESVETVAGTLSAVKSVTGTVGIIVIILTALSPILKTMVSMWLFRACSAILQPIAQPSVVMLTTDIADSIAVVLAAMLCVCLLFCGGLGVLL